MATPLPPTIRIFGTYTDAGSGWNFDGDNDAALINYMRDVIAPQAGGVVPNAYNAFAAWGTPYEFAGNMSWTVWNMMSAGFQGIPIVSYRPHNGDNNPYGWNDTQALVDYADGEFDDTLRALVDGIYDSECRFVIFRFAYEYNFDFMPYAMSWDADKQQQWKAMMEHVFRLTRDYAREKYPDMVWLNSLCSAMGRGGQPAMSVVPDPATWDILAPDFYGTYYGDGDKENPDHRKDFWHNGASGYENPWTAITQQALDLNKPLMLSESGCGGPAGVHNDEHWIDWLADRVVEFRAAGGRWWGFVKWDIIPGDGSWRWSDGTQPALAEALGRRIGDLLGDEISTTDPLGSAVPPPIDPPVEPPIEPPVTTPPPGSIVPPSVEVPIAPPVAAPPPVTVTVALDKPSNHVEVTDVSQWATASQQRPILTIFGNSTYDVVMAKTEGGKSQLQTGLKVQPPDAHVGSLVRLAPPA